MRKGLLLNLRKAYEGKKENKISIEKGNKRFEETSRSKIGMR